MYLTYINTENDINQNEIFYDNIHETQENTMYSSINDDFNNINTNYEEPVPQYYSNIIYNLANNNVMYDLASDTNIYTDENL